MTQSVATALFVFYAFGLLHIGHSGPLDAALSWARADKLPIDIDVNLPWLPCKSKRIHLLLLSILMFPLVFFFVVYFNSIELR